MNGHFNLFQNLKFHLQLVDLKKTKTDQGQMEWETQKFWLYIPQTCPYSTFIVA